MSDYFKNIGYSDEFLSETRESLNSIPANLRIDFANRLKSTFRDIANLASDFNSCAPDKKRALDDERTKILDQMNTHFEDFLKSGGDDSDWNVLSASVQNGSYDIIYPS